MQVLLHSDPNTDGRHGMAEHLQTVVKGALGRFGERVTRVEAHLSDVHSQAKASADGVHCTLEARLLGLDAVIAHLRLLVAATALPINADFENGFADRPEGVARNVALAVETGIAALSIEDWSGSALYEPALAVERLRAARAAIDAIDPSVMLVGRSENFRVPGMAVSESISRAVAYSEAGADCLFVPFILDPGAIAELVAAVAPKPVNVIVQDYDQRIRMFAALGVRRCSVGGSLARRAWLAFDEAAQALKRCEADALT